MKATITRDRVAGFRRTSARLDDVCDHDVICVGAFAQVNWVHLTVWSPDGEVEASFFDEHSDPLDVPTDAVPGFLMQLIPELGEENDDLYDVVHHWCVLQIRKNPPQGIHQWEKPQ
jgi:hypothetical protein